MAQESGEILVGGNGHVFAAPVGSTEPTTATASLAAAWVDLGYTDEDGVTLTNSRTIDDINVWQSRYPARKLITGEDFRVSFNLRQWNAENLIFAFGGGEVALSSGTTYKYTPAAAGSVEESALIVEWEDTREGDVSTYRLVVGKGMVVDDVETNITRTAAANLPITFSITPVSSESDPWFLLSDDPAIAS